MPAVPPRAHAPPERGADNSMGPKSSEQPSARSSGEDASKHRRGHSPSMANPNIQNLRRKTRTFSGTEAALLNNLASGERLRRFTTHLAQRTGLPLFERSALAHQKTQPNGERPHVRVSAGDDQQTDVFTNGESEVDSNENELGKVEEDVFFPMKEPETTNGLDFKEMEKFAADERQAIESGLYVPGVGRLTKEDLFGYDSVPAGMENNHTHSPLPDLMLEKDNIVSLKHFPSICATRPRPGARPPAGVQNRFSYFSTLLDETIHVPTFSSLVANHSERSFASLFGSGEGVWWLDVLSPTEEEMRMIAKAFRLHPLTTEDIRTQEPREKVELFKSYYFVCFRSFDHDHESPGYLEPINMYMTVLRSGILSFHYNASAHPANVRRRIRQLQDYVSISSDWVCYAVIDDITDAFAPVIALLEREVDALEDDVLVVSRCDYTGSMLQKLAQSRRMVMSLARLLSGKADVIKGFAKRCNEKWDVAPTGEIGLFLGDIQDHIVTMHQSLILFEKNLARSQSNYLAQLSVDSIQGNNRINSALAKITVIGVILVPMNIVTSLWGMNVAVPGQYVDGSMKFHWFGGILGMLLLWAVVCYWYLRRLRFI